MSAIDIDAPGTTQLLMGNEAIARGALEAGVGVAAAYPGNPSSEILTNLAQCAASRGLYAEWSVNEKVALEMALAASLSGIRAICAMKQNGLNAALDTLANIAMSGVNAGLVLVVCDDPGGISSTNEQDSRHVARALDLPLFEPGTFEEAKEMTRQAFDISEAAGNVCMVRSVTRISHARGNVRLGRLSVAARKPRFDMSRAYATISMGAKFHRSLHEKLGMLRETFEGSSFNLYEGPKKAELLIVTSGSGWLYALEAVAILGAGQSVGVLKLGTTWPLPAQFVLRHLRRARRILVIEETDPFLETNVKEVAAQGGSGRKWEFFGKGSGHAEQSGEINPDTVIRAAAAILGVEQVTRPAAYEVKCNEALARLVPPRELQFCAGCPHRATFWAVKDALKLDGRNGVVIGDVGCYSMALLATGFNQIRTVHAMGSGPGVASGLGMLRPFGFDQPVLAVCGDSTFFHAAIPALLNGIHNRADFTLLYLDNGGTAMTGFQPHPGTDRTAAGEAASRIDPERLLKAMDVPVVVTDPYDIEGTTRLILDAVSRPGLKVIISRRECALLGSAGRAPRKRVRVDGGRCIGEECGCNRYCTAVFRCPGLIWDREGGKARIDEAVCTGCGVCTAICPQGAIVAEDRS